MIFLPAAEFYSNFGNSETLQSNSLTPLMLLKMTSLSAVKLFVKLLDVTCEYQSLLKWDSLIFIMSNTAFWFSKT